MCFRVDAFVILLTLMLLLILVLLTVNVLFCQVDLVCKVLRYVV